MKDTSTPVKAEKVTWTPAEKRAWKRREKRYEKVREAHAADVLLAIHENQIEALIEEQRQRAQGRIEALELLEDVIPWGELSGEEKQLLWGFFLEDFNERYRSQVR